MEKSKYAGKAVLLTTTFSQYVTDMRAQLALRTCRVAVGRGLDIIVVDGSPCADFKVALGATGAIVIDQVEPGMEGSRRQVLKAGLEMFPQYLAYCWLEPEKHPMVPLLDSCLKRIIEPIDGDPADVVIPRRKALVNYPQYQQWSEMTANWQLDDLTGLYGIDWYSGPRIMSRRATEVMASYDSGGDGKWKIIFLPLVRMMYYGWTIKSVTVGYVHPIEQLVEDSPEMRAKRDEQREALVDGMARELWICGRTKMELDRLMGV